jgi:hypothetical protein
MFDQHLHVMLKDFCHGLLAMMFEVNMISFLNSRMVIQQMMNNQNHLIHYHDDNVAAAAVVVVVY